MKVLDKIVALINSQIGYKETGVNITKFSEYFDKNIWQYFNTKKQGAEWCAIFIIWAFCQIIGPDETRKFLGLPKPANNCAAGCKFFAEYLEKMGYKVAKSKGQVGSIIFFKTKKADCGHVGYVVKVDDDKYYTVEGNKGDSVKNGSYSKNSTTIYAVFNPDYSKLDVNPEPAPTPKPVSKNYTVNVNSWLNVRRGPSTKYAVVGKLYDDDVVSVTEKNGDFGKIDKIVFISSKHPVNKYPRVSESAIKEGAWISMKWVK